MAINVKLEGDGIVPHLTKAREMEQEAKRYFYFKSKLWRAIQEHIQSKDCVLFKRKGVVATYSAGPGISLEDAYLNVCLKGETQMMTFKIRVSYWADPDNGDDRGTSDEREFIHFPADLESDFTEKKFDLWIKEKRKKRDAEQASEDIKTLQNLVAKYPDRVVTMLPQEKLAEIIQWALKNKTPRRLKSKRSSRTKTSS